MSITLDTVLPTVGLASGSLVSGTVRDPGDLPVVGVDTDWFLSGTQQKVTTPLDKTDASSLFRVILSAGTYDVLFIPPEGSGLDSLMVTGIAVGSTDLTLSDQTLGAAVLPSLVGITPTEGFTEGGTAVQISGTAFRPGAKVLVGGVETLSTTVLSPNLIEAITGPRPAGLVDVWVTNPGGPRAEIPGAFRYVDSPVPVVLTIGVGPMGVRLSLGITGQSSYTVFRSTSPTVFGQADILEVTTANDFLDIEALLKNEIFFYRVE